jgi:hypothetical protein
VTYRDDPDWQAARAEYVNGTGGTADANLAARLAAAARMLAIEEAHNRQ